MTTFTRRLQKIGSSILVSLPKEWIDANNLDKTNQVEIETNQKNYEKLIDAAADEISSFVEKANLENDEIRL